MVSGDNDDTDDENSCNEKAYENSNTDDIDIENTKKGIASGSSECYVRFVLMGRLRQQLKSIFYLSHSIFMTTETALPSSMLSFS